MSRFIQHRALIALFLLAEPASLLAVGSAGFTNQTVGAKAFGMGNAFVAVADDPSTVFFNPGALADLSETTLSLGASPILPETRYIGAGNKSETADDILTTPYLYGSNRLKRRPITFGFGLNVPYGLATQWPEDGPLRHSATESQLYLAKLTGAVSHRVSRRVSIGAGVIYGRAEAELASRINQTDLNSAIAGTTVVSPDGNKTLAGDGAGWGYSAGVLWTPLARHRFGLSYQSEITVELEGRTKLTQLVGPASAVFGGTDYSISTKTDVQFPQSVMLGYAYQRDKWTFAIDGEWVNYAALEDTRFVFKETDPVRATLLNQENRIERDWRDTWNIAVGADYRISQSWSARVGSFHYPRVVPTSRFDPRLPENSRTGLTCGGSFHFDRFAVDLGYAYIPFDTRQVARENRPTVSGTYRTTAHIVSVGVTYRTNGVASGRNSERGK